MLVFFVEEFLSRPHIPRTAIIIDLFIDCLHFVVSEWRGVIHWWDIWVPHPHRRQGAAGRQHYGGGKDGAFWILWWAATQDTWKILEDTKLHFGLLVCNTHKMCTFMKTLWKWVLFLGSLVTSCIRVWRREQDTSWSVLFWWLDDFTVLLGCSYLRSSVWNFLLLKNVIFASVKIFIWAICQVKWKKKKKKIREKRKKKNCNTEFIFGGQNFFFFQAVDKHIYFT